MWKVCDIIIHTKEPGYTAALMRDDYGAYAYQVCDDMGRFVHGPCGPYDDMKSCTVAASDWQLVAHDDL